VLSEAFSVAGDVHIRKIAVEAGFIPRILERLGGIAGEKPREKDETVVVSDPEDDFEDIVLERKKSNTKNIDKKKRKGVGYSASQGVQFNVTAFLENKKARNE
jgi:hypothetical protein